MTDFAQLFRESVERRILRALKRGWEDIGSTGEYTREHLPGQPVSVRIAFDPACEVPDGAPLPDPRIEHLRGAVFIQCGDESLVGAWFAGAKPNISFDSILGAVSGGRQT